MTIHTPATTFEALTPPGSTPVTIAYGDGVGPEIMNAALQMMLAAGARLAVEPIVIGETAYRGGHSSGIPPEAWASIQRTGLLFKAPITTPQGGGYKSLNVTLRKSLGLFANTRPCISYSPFVATKHPVMDVVIVRENEEDLYAGIEHRQTDDVVQCLKLVSRPGCEKIVRYAFDYALANGRRKVTCFTKDNIMKMTDGLFRQVFDEVAADYPGIENEHMIIDIGAARLAARPEQFDVVVTLNLYGDIVSDIAAEITGSVGLGGSSNIGANGAMFEAVHGSAPQIAGQGVANPSGLLLSGIMMLVHIGQADVAARLHLAWLKTIEDGIHTGDIFREGVSARKVGTQAFADAVIARLGQAPRTLPRPDYAAATAIIPFTPQRKPPADKRLVGIDIFVHAADVSPAALAARMKAGAPGELALTMVSNRGVKVWPTGQPQTFLTDHWRCRFEMPAPRQFNKAMVAELLAALARAGIDFIKTEHLFTFDGVPGYTLGQGQ
ncbi:MAG: NADP-dependent isocitrate dehydrogenase [Phreatobacter sp.]|uniref:NADP-dependent isocitrate dehydrogenase n=1 Tax=Phreatobacter sp. TaxID=1966341 RepID=UPI002736D2B3|nr:NADP-dependent isocitrate dehydrogenase [Phreatobacter sp.]MDP2804028.1 NADP-dependent isocitrate dehydrogenase [Phreatobacter sp.]